MDKSMMDDCIVRQERGEHIDRGGMLTNMQLDWRIQRHYGNSLLVTLYRWVLARFMDAVYISPKQGFKLVTDKHYEL